MIFKVFPIKKNVKTLMENTNEKKAQKFLNYIADNLPELKKALKKNITFNEDLFDDVISESIIKIYNSILRNGTEIEDYKQYFFIVSKFTYIYYDNRNKKNDTIEIRNLFDGGFDVCDDDTDKEEIFDKTLTALKQIRNYLNNEFGEMKTKIYMSYMGKRTEGRTSYKDISEKFQIPLKEVSSTINEIKKHLNDCDEMKKIKKKYYD